MTEGSDTPVAIVGAGPCGLATAVALGAAGLAAVVFDKGAIAQSVADYPTRLTMFSTPEKLAIGGVPFASTGFRPTRAETLAYYRTVAATHRLDVREYHRVTAVRREAQVFVVTAEGVAAEGVVAEGVVGERVAAAGYGEARSQEVNARAVVIATGYFDYPNALGVPGEDSPHVSHRFVDGHAARGRRVVVVGGGNSAVECAIELARCGATITLVHYEPAFVSHVIKPWILPEFEAHIAAGRVTVRWGSRVRAIEPGAVWLRSASTADTHAGESGVAAAHVGAGRAGAARADAARVDADLVYLMTGYTPQPGLLGALGVAFDADTGIPAHDPATMETNVPGVYVAGVLASGKKANGVFIENGRGHGELIAAALL